VDEDDIVKKLSKATASTAFNFKERSLATSEPEAPAPVGTAHKRIVPEQELPKLSERERFWQDEQVHFCHGSAIDRC
jgi:hypothetical protein